MEQLTEIGGFVFVSIVLQKGEAVPQHIHTEDHPTYCGNGRAKFFVDYEYVRDICAGDTVLVYAGKRHWFEAVEDNTRLVCIWTKDAAERAMAKGTL